MIRRHDFNCAWWGDEVGIVTSLDFFALPSAQQEAALAPFAWVEFRAEAQPGLQRMNIHRAGFCHVDIQIHYRLNLSRLSSRTDVDALEGLEVRWAEFQPFRVMAGDIQPFLHERFLNVPGITEARLCERYARWCNQMVREHPEYCLAVHWGGQLQGWFLSLPSTRGLNLALAMLGRNATITGAHLFYKSVHAYGARGETTGWASFSASNTPVMNILASLGARFSAPQDCWIWSREG